MISSSEGPKSERMERMEEALEATMQMRERPKFIYHIIRNE